MQPSPELIIALFSSCAGTIFVAGTVYARLLMVEREIREIKRTHIWLVKSVTALLIKQGLHVPTDND